MLVNLIKSVLNCLGLGSDSRLRQRLSAFYWTMMYKATYCPFTQKIIYRWLKPHYVSVIKRLRGRIAKNEPIRVGFFVTMDSIFPFQPLFERMLEDPFDSSDKLASGFMNSEDFEFEVFSA